MAQCGQLYGLSRIDIFYLSRELAVGAESEIAAFPLSGHDIITIKITNSIKTTVKGCWKLNTSLLSSENFQNLIRNKPNFANPLEWWDRGIKPISKEPPFHSLLKPPGDVTLNTLDLEEQQLLEGPVTLSEVKSALARMDTGKSPRV